MKLVISKRAGRMDGMEGPKLKSPLKGHILQFDFIWSRYGSRLKDTKSVARVRQSGNPGGRGRSLGFDAFFAKAVD